MTDEEGEALLQRAQARLDRIRAEQQIPEPPREEQPAHSPALATVLKGIRVMSEAECEAARARWERHQEAARVEVRARSLTPEREADWLDRCGVGTRHQRLELQADLVPLAIRDWAEQSARGASAILCGPTGSGKTAAAIWALRTVYRSGSAGPDRWNCPSALFATASELFACVFEKRPLGRYEQADHLVIDDWGMAYETDWPLSMLDRLIDRRWCELRSTIITTNLTPDAMAERYPRVHSRLSDSSGPGVVVLNRQDLRRARA